MSLGGGGESLIKDAIDYIKRRGDNCSSWERKPRISSTQHATHVMACGCADAAGEKPLILTWRWVDISALVAVQW